MTPTPVHPLPFFRGASREDCAHLTVFADMATRRLTSFMWGQAAAPGQSAFEIGRDIIRNNESHFTHFRNWRVAEHEGQCVGAINSYVIPEVATPVAATGVVEPLNELKALAAGTFYVSAAAIYPEHRGRGFGRSLLAEAEGLARSAGHGRLTLMVGSFNQGAYRLYRQFGFTEWERRPFIPFPGSDAPGEWILMVKEL